MPLTLQNRRVEDIAIVKCSGRITEGLESAALQKCLKDLLPYGADVILDLADVDFVDSSGLGLLVRFLMRTQRAQGNLKLCGVRANLREILRITKLNTLFDVYNTEAEAVAEFYQRSKAGAESNPFDTDILCVEQSVDVLAYVRELLRQAGYAVLSATNLPDAMTLLRATRPKMLVISADLRANRATATAESFNRLADTLSVVELPVGFSTNDPAEVSQQLLDRVRSVIEGSAPAIAAR
jgi:anti-sigma B factor antagonist